MRKINKIIIHCSATPPDMDVGVDVIRVWHTRDNGWSDIGYHRVIKRDGEVQEGRPVERSGAHTKGHNEDSIGICMAGGVDKNGNPDANFTDGQWKSLVRELRALKALYPKATIHGHNEFARKACPSFDVQKWLQEYDL